MPNEADDAIKNLNSQFCGNTDCYVDWAFVKLECKVFSRGTSSLTYGQINASNLKFTVKTYCIMHNNKTIINNNINLNRDNSHDN